MTKLLDKAIERIRHLPDARQDEAAEILLSMATQDPDAVRLSSKQESEVRRRLKAPPTYATDEQVSEVFRKLAE